MGFALRQSGDVVEIAQAMGKWQRLVTRPWAVWPPVWFCIGTAPGRKQGANNLLEVVIVATGGSACAPPWSRPFPRC